MERGRGRVRRKRDRQTLASKGYYVYYLTKDDAAYLSHHQAELWKNGLENTNDKEYMVQQLSKTEDEAVNWKEIIDSNQYSYYVNGVEGGQSACASTAGCEYRSYAICEANRTWI